MKYQDDNAFMLLMILYQTIHWSCVGQVCTSVVVSENLSCRVSDVFCLGQIQINLWLHLAIQKFQ